MADASEPTEVGSARPGISDADLVARFESLGGAGHGSEFGRFQFKHGLAELGLLGWADLGAELLIQALEQKFHGVGDPENTVIFRPDGSEEWWIRDTRFWMATRSGIRAEGGNANQAAPAILDRLKRLRAALIQDLRDGRKIFVFRDMISDLTEATLSRLHAAVRSYGPSTLFYLRYADPEHAAGLVEVAAPNLLIGYVTHFGVSRDNRGLGEIDDVLLDLCRKAWALADPAAAPSVTQAPAQRPPDPVPVNTPDTAVASAQRAVMQAPRSLVARLALAEALRRAGRMNAALTEMCAAAVVAPDDVRAYAGLGELMHSMGDFSGAEAAYRKAISLVPDEAHYYHQISMICLKTGRHADAIVAAEAAIEQEQDNPARLGHLAVILGNAGEYDRARTVVLSAIDEMPDRAAFHILYGNLFAQEGRLEEALETAQGTVDQMPGDAEVLAHLAEIEQMCGHLKDAEEHLRGAMALAPNNGKLRAQMARLVDVSAAQDAV
jgi:Flp pilus assembly protein TadD